MPQSTPPLDSTPSPRVARFGAFELAPARRRLLLDGQAVRLSDRALDLLVALAQRPGEVVPKQRLLELAWPGLVVEESNLRVQIAALRRALDDPPNDPRYIASVPGRGYAFVGELRWAPEGEGEHAPASAGMPSAAVPHPVKEPAAPQALAARPLVGRDDFVTTVQYELALRRLITITGPGGIGKTAVARLVAARRAATYADGVQLLDLAPLTRGEQVVPQLASLLRIPDAGAGTLGAVIEHLRSLHLLLVLDNCEHMVDAVCALAQALLAQCEGVDLLATSREALRVAGEYVKRLQPLAVPPEDAALTAQAALDFPAVRLLVERIAALDVQLQLDARELALLREICRRLDGLPLALELAATWVPVLGLQGVSDLLDQRLSQLGGGARDAPPRHRSLAATIDWSYDALAQPERALFRLLAVFPASFTLAAAESVCRLHGGDAMARSALELLGRLVEKSLVSVELAQAPPRYRLFESLRRYALEKLHDAGELRAARQAHARQVLASCGGAAADDPPHAPSVRWLRRHGGDIADIRAALDWAFAEDGDARLAIALVVASAPCWFRLLLVPELQGHLERAIALARRLGLDDHATLMRLHMALAHAVFHTSGPAHRVGEVLGTALSHARTAGDVKSALEILWARFGNDACWGDYAGMWRCVLAVRALSERQAHPCAGPLYERISALGHHLRGEQGEALRHARRALVPVPRSGAPGHSLVYDHRTAAGSHHARALWLAGYADQAAEVVAATAENARQIDQPFALGYFLVFGACPVSLWRGDHAAAWRFVDLLLDVAAGIAFNVWRCGGQFFARVLRVLESGELEAAVDGAQALAQAAATPYQAQLLGTVDGRLLSWAALEAASAGEAHWATAELIRVRGERLWGQGGEARWDEAAAQFQLALALSRAQQARAWTLRAACSLARLRRDQGRRGDARAVLAEAYGGFTEGFQTRDLRQARALLEELGA